ncbi:PAS domain S-box protein [Syntrophomonas wolfei]|uniref:PAS domain S-box protein n=1 Tax=Syntrophomonas wolfei TaxID=863 RepID=UPI0009D6CEB8|nr:PAS domain S-box protein [Syntrophomonas wolfei]
MLVFSKFPEDIKKPSFILSEKLLASIFDSLPDAVLVIDINKKIIAWNRALEKMTGITTAQMLGKSNYEYSLPFYRTRRPLLIDYVLKPEQNIPREYLSLGRESDAMVCENIIHIEGQEELYLWARAAPLYDQNGELVGAIESIRDITAQKRIEKAIGNNEQRLRYIAEHLLDIIIEIDKRGLIKYNSPSPTLFLKHNPEELMGKPIYNLLHPNDIMLLTTTLKEVIKNKVSKSLEIRIKDSEGDYHWVELVVNPQFNNNSEVAGAICVGRVVTERKLAEDALKASEERYRELFENANDIVFIQDISGPYLDFNKAAQATTGFTREELLSISMERLVAPEYLDLTKEMMKQKINQGGATRYEIELIGKNRNIIPVEVSSRLIRYSDQSIAIQGTARDITKRRQAEKALAAEKERLALILSRIGHGIITTDNNGVITFINTEAERFFEWKNEYARGKNMLDVVPLVEDYTNLNRSLLLAYNQKQHPVDIRIINNLGQISLLSTTVTHIPGNNGNNHGMVFVFRDVTELRKAESQLALSQKLESIGQLAAGIAHEINNPMQYIGDNLSFLNEAFANIFSILEQVKALASSQDISSSILDLVKLLEKSQRELDFFRNEIPQAIQQSLEGVTGVSDIVTALRNFAHPGFGEKQIANINNAIMGTVSIAKNEWKHLADLELNLGNDLPAVKMVVNQINQVLLNIIVNASHSIQDAIEKGLYPKGKIVVSSLINESYVEIRISDNGMGIPDTIINKVFDPFFTTKEVGKGTGQGLAISHDIIVNKHNGSIELESEVGRGTTFYIRLPIEGSI